MPCVAFPVNLTHSKLLVDESELRLFTKVMPLAGHMRYQPECCGGCWFTSCCCIATAVRANVEPGQPTIHFASAHNQRSTMEASMYEGCSESSQEEVGFLDCLHVPRCHAFPSVVRTNSAPQLVTFLANACLSLTVMARPTATNIQTNIRATSCSAGVTIIASMYCFRLGGMPARLRCHESLISVSIRACRQP